MDKFIESQWFLKGIALIFALLLFISFGLERNPNQSGFPFFTGTKETVEEVPVKIENYDQENTVVDGIPATVDVTLEGSNSLVWDARLKKFEVYVDLKDLQLGKNEVEFKHRNVNEDLKVTIKPKTATVYVYEKVTKEFPVTISYVNESSMKEGYVIQDATSKVERVKVSGPKEEVERVSKVVAPIDVKNADKDFEKEVPLSARDAKDNPLAVKIEPAVAKVAVDIMLPSKKVPVVPKKTGTPPEGVTIDNLEPEVKEVTIFGLQKELNTVTSISVEVDVSDIKESTVVQGEMILPEGIKSVTPEKLKVRVNVKKEETKTVDNIKINLIGLSDEYKVTFISPSNGMIALDIFGFQDIIDSVTAKEVEAYVDVSKLSPGTHELPLQAKGPQNVTVDVQNKKVKFNIVKNEA
ncbi:YbbR-like domain-containing protein [Priestia taiwanensis]|uniref:CdaA regulatory protein CdaR n=1 Tax=Priestia taiwanensis TaxID=1347902 RepID=A0A917AZ08_9BACI|nr:CdaR family protein [Priestia taiwanensis]MBM7365074.1 YbbR domain-containing protein [Priestia taiwanensis]GGE83860.1 CdaA regulatory protein CdaR [Priestia taiwanensis]